MNGFLQWSEQSMSFLQALHPDLIPPLALFPGAVIARGHVLPGLILQSPDQEVSLQRQSLLLPLVVGQGKSSESPGKDIHGGPSLQVHLVVIQWRRRGHLLVAGLTHPLILVLVVLVMLALVL